MPSLLPATRWALTPPFHPYHRSLNPSGGLFSVARSVASRRPGVTWQSTQWSSDFPRDGNPPRDHPADPCWKVIGSAAFGCSWHDGEALPSQLHDRQQVGAGAGPLLDDRPILHHGRGALAGSLEGLASEEANPGEQDPPRIESPGAEVRRLEVFQGCDDLLIVAQFEIGLGDDWPNVGMPIPGAALAAVRPESGQEGSSGG